MNRDVLKVVKSTAVELYPGTPPKLPWKLIGMIAAAGIIGFGVGMNIWGPPKTIVKTEVGPTHTVYSTPNVPVPVKTIEVDQPQSCKDSAALAAALSANSVIMSDSSEPIIDAMKEAGIALGSRDKNKMNAATEKVARLNARTLKAKQDYAVIYPQFTVKWEQCEKESK